MSDYEYHSSYRSSRRSGAAGRHTGSSREARRRARRRRAILRLSLLVIAAAALVFLLVALLNKYHIEMSRPEEDAVEVAYGEEFKMPEVTALYKGSLLHRKGTPVEVRRTGTVDTSKPGTYELVWTAEHRNIKGTCKLTVNVVDKTSPVITLNGTDVLFLTQNGQDTDPGVTAVDEIDGDLTAQVKVGGNVDITKAGQYQRTYTVSDTSGNEVTIVREVRVVVGEVDPEGRVIYLTFDDGPGPYTQELLDILDKYNVKVTFFVTDQFPKYRDMIAEEAKRGHTVAIHSQTHDFATIYKSTDAYFKDLDAMNEIIKAQTGEYANIVRFPGGGSNTVSRHYKVGIMTELAQMLEEKGFKYADWNVDSDDAGSARTSDTVYENVTRLCKGRKASVVLQHDIKQFSVEAVERIIQWGQENGYRFLPMDQTSPMAHHKINN